MKPRHGHISESCRPISEVLSRIGDKWTSLIITRLSQQPMRFNELKRNVHGISQKVLTASLRALERDGFVERTVFPTTPPTVEYRLTPFGEELAEPLTALTRFALTNAARMDAARAAYDTKHGEPMPDAAPKYKPQQLRLN
ncbi:helix-turn-helix domain-containing protein [Nitratireductor sp. ZSWI3]|uniref:winged helix-turn-helix transcriptional regulator n=1 Tax=Nitratireductor sp. ZSWI3 TaxID=2966359 RepID=UPI0021506733|nr:helix-turn-helix domain-containing protein [Nitratireductor sp. ZSWI3]MCR4265760.1 helix-turn-helix transcriptional regulator [Nitratireductor sp. ZSWI3]